MDTNLPNLLTLSRIAVIPLIIAAFYLPVPASSWTAFGLFAYASVTDYFDGMLARRRNQTTDFGRFLDPIADKLLVAAVVIMMVAAGTIAGAAVIAAMLILLREILVSGLREFLAGRQIGVPVSRLAKWKTGVQLVAIALLLLTDALPQVGAVGTGLLWIAAVLTVYTGYDYLRGSIAQLTAKPERADPAADRR
ncbi:MAG: CDP-diacylglycerol--glycerol-3-phosphate 3-phosphatidyltransferase [Proteobacteria bacterium]|nr:CDP-diacylglycerol--glycerol-3-phosphate 3-phosphatidyltransferase [Pseudomonadota bacterium]MDA1058702.1 CDP-diacylglycerol--glycerol-3-phosphate 3-phosphatidyltransferase [Pseudomonadota bacterium]